MKVIRQLILLFILPLILTSGRVWADEGDLNKFEDQMNKPASGPTIENPSKDKDLRREKNQERWRENHSDEDCTGNNCPDDLRNIPGELGGLLIGLVFASPFYVPPLLIGDHYNKTYGLESYPYEKDMGYLTAPNGKSWLVRAATSHLWTAHDPQAWKGELSLYTPGRLGLDTSYTRYNENLRDASDSLAFLDIVPTFSFARTAKWDWRVGMGYESVEGRDHHDRVKLAYQVKYFFAKPFRLDANASTSLAAGKPIFEISSGVAYQWNRFEIKVAYERRNISDVVLEGPALSLGVWF
jgi:hypothetical protein